MRSLGQRLSKGILLAVEYTAPIFQYIQHIHEPVLPRQALRGHQTDTHDSDTA
jgi:hypothetical protein